MSKKLVGARIKSTAGDFAITIPGAKKALVLEWKGDKPTFVPLDFTYIDDFGKKRTQMPGVPKHLLTAGLVIQDGKVVGGKRAYPHLELVEEVYEDELPEGLGVPTEAKPQPPKAKEKEK